MVFSWVNGRINRRSVIEEWSLETRRWVSDEWPSQVTPISFFKPESSCATMESTIIAAETIRLVMKSGYMQEFI